MQDLTPEPIQEKEDLKNRLAEEKQFQAGEKEKLQNDFDNMRKRVVELTQEIGRLQTQAVTTSGYSGYASTVPIIISNIEYPSTVHTFQMCSKCGKTYEVINVLSDKGLCNDCSK